MNITVVFLPFIPGLLVRRLVRRNFSGDGSLKDEDGPASPNPPKAKKTDLSAYGGIRNRRKDKLAEKYFKIL